MRCGRSAVGTAAIGAAAVLVITGRVLLPSAFSTMRPGQGAGATTGPAVRTYACNSSSAADVPILAAGDCPPGMVGYDCEQRLDLLLSYLPEAERWRRDWHDARAATCQRAALESLLVTLARAHDSAYHLRPRSPRSNDLVDHVYVINDPKHPCTVGKMLHQFAVANHAALTEPRNGGRPRLRWQVRDDPAWHYTRNGTLCRGLGRGWFCLWRPFPASVPGTARLPAPAQLWPPTRPGPGSGLQYLLMGAVMKALTVPTEELSRYLRGRIRATCADGRPADTSVVPPRCPGARRPVAAVQVRHGDSCEGPKQQVKGPRNMMIRDGQRKYRYCYTWPVYARELRAMRDRYGVDTVLLATDDPEVVREATAEPGFNWVHVAWPREQLAHPKPWVEFRANLDEHVPLSLAAELELLSHADVFVGSFGSQVGRSIYYRMLAHARAGSLPPFASVDGYGLCCDFREDCTEADILRRNRDFRECIRRGGADTFLRLLRPVPRAWRDTEFPGQDA